MDKYELTILGTASGLPEADRTHAALVLTQGSNLWMFDAGEGASSALLRSNLDPEHLKAIYITHLHPDHCVGVFMILQYLHVKYFKDKLSIYIPGGAIEVTQQFMNQLYLVPGEIHPDYSLKPLEEKHQLTEDVYLQTYPTNHLKHWDELDIPKLETHSYAFRIVTPEQSYFYSGDIREVADVEAYLRKDDLLILEGAHIEYDAVLNMAQKFEMKRLILTHALPERKEQLKGLQARAREIGVAIEFACDRYKITI